MATEEGEISADTSPEVNEERKGTGSQLEHLVNEHTKRAPASGSPPDVLKKEMRYISEDTSYLVGAIKTYKEYMQEIITQNRMLYDKLLTLSHDVETLKQNTVELKQMVKNHNMVSKDDVIYKGTVQFASRNKKMALCSLFMETGSCPYGKHCYFAHGRAELVSHNAGMHSHLLDNYTGPNNMRQSPY